MDQINKKYEQQTAEKRSRLLKTVAITAAVAGVAAAVFIVVRRRQNQ